jgi:Co/Zn/Cd efflux system component
MNDFTNDAFGAGHDHIFLGAAHEQNERRTWMVIALCAAMMVAEIVGGSLFGSLALIADGLHMSTHAGAMLIAALAYTYARKHASDRASCSARASSVIWRASRARSCSR